MLGIMTLVVSGFTIFVKQQVRGADGFLKAL